MCHSIVYWTTCPKWMLLCSLTRLSDDKSCDTQACSVGSRCWACRFHDPELCVASARFRSRFRSNLTVSIAYMICIFSVTVTFVHIPSSSLFGMWCDASSPRLMPTWPRTLEVAWSFHAVVHSLFLTADTRSFKDSLSLICLAFSRLFIRIL